MNRWYIMMIWTKILDDKSGVNYPWESFIFLLQHSDLRRSFLRIAASRTRCQGHQEMKDWRCESSTCLKFFNGRQLMPPYPCELLKFFNGSGNLPWKLSIFMSWRANNKGNAFEAASERWIPTNLKHGFLLTEAPKG